MRSPERQLVTFHVSVLNKWFLNVPCTAIFLRYHTEYEGTVVKQNQLITSLIKTYCGQEYFNLKLEGLKFLDGEPHDNSNRPD